MYIIIAQRTLEGWLRKESAAIHATITGVYP